MSRVKICIILFSFLFLFSGCTNHSTVNDSVTTNIDKQDSANEIKTISFEYFFRGFITLRENQVKSYPHESYIIETNEDWHDFMDKYVPGIPYYISVNYSKECLVFSVIFPAKPSYSTGADIKTFIINENKLEPEYMRGANGEQNDIYAQNIDGIMHCYVNLVKIDKKDVPKDTSNIYHKGDNSKN